MNNSPRENAIDTLVNHSTKQENHLVQRWYAFTSLPDAPVNSTFAQREAVRRSKLSSSVIFFFSALILGLLPVTYLVIDLYPSYFWLTLGLFIICSGSLFALNRRGYTNTTGFIVTFGAFLTLTTALFSTIPFDETTLQGYDMFILLLLLSVALLPMRWVFLFFVLVVGVIIGTLLLMPLSPNLQEALDTRLMIILARPIGTLFMGGGVACILATHLTNAIIRANRAEIIARLEHEQMQMHKNLEQGIDQILQTHVQISNGNLSARAPLSDDNMLWQIARALNTLLVRFQRAIQSEQKLHNVEQAVQKTVQMIQEADRMKEQPRLTLTHTEIDPMIAALQGRSIAYEPPTSPERSSTNIIPKDESALWPYRQKQQW